MHQFFSDFKVLWTEFDADEFATCSHACDTSGARAHAVIKYSLALVAIGLYQPLTKRDRLGSWMRGLASSGEGNHINGQASVI